MGFMPVTEFFNHESPRRENLVTRKITRGLVRVFLGLDPCLYLGNLDALRDGDMLEIMLKCNGRCYNNPKQKIMLSRPANNIG